MVSELVQNDIVYYTYLVIISCIPKQSSKRDGIGDAAQVDEKHSRNGLNMEAVINITAIPRNLPFDVQPQSTANPIKDRIYHLG